MAIPKLPPPPRNPQTFEEVNDYLRRIHVFLGGSKTDGLDSVNGKLSMKAAAAPPAPIIAEQTLSIPIGLQFVFNFIQDGSTVDGYWIYKNSANDPATASRYKFIPQSASKGVYTFQDTVGQGVTAYYWVSAINPKGESAKTPAGSSASLTSTQTMTVYRPTQFSGNYVSPGAAFDGNLNLAAVGSLNSIKSSLAATWGVFPAAAGTPTSVTLKIVSDGRNTSDGLHTLSYSVDGGGSFATIYSLSDDFSQRTESIVLLAAQDLGLVQVRATARTLTSSGTVQHEVFEIWIEVVV
jgi:hypothetical protein